jgi:hydroxymethylbilane synthase
VIIAATIKQLSGIVIASRASPLAMWQARNIQKRLAVLYPRTTVTIRGMATQGDRILDKTLDKIGGKGLFVKELEDALAAGSADIAVHSMKDVPMVLPSGFEIVAITEREDARDAFVSNQYASLNALPAGSRIGTSSLRRESQIRARFPQLVVDPLRGNVQTRLDKLDAGNYAAIILAAAGLRRLGLAERITAILTPEESLPAPGQGALGIECRTERADVISMMRALNHESTAACVRAERALSGALSGSCQLPLGSFAQADGGRLRLRGLVASQDGTQLVRAELTGDARAPETLGGELAARLRAQGATEILAALERR